MTCDEIRRTIDSLYFGETSFDEEEALHAHTAECASCRAELNREQALQRLLSERELQPSPFVLRNCRDRLHEALEVERAHVPVRGMSWWQNFKTAFTPPTFVPGFAKPVGAIALMAFGFLTARVAPLPGLGGGFQAAGLVDPSTSKVRFVEPGQGGAIQLVVDETRQRVISGRLDDPRIRAFLVAAAKDPSDPGLRGESVEILKDRPESDEIRGVLLFALQHDTNDGVRLKALEGLKRFATQPEVRKALSQVLLTDSNPGLRIQAVDLLTQSDNEEHVVGVLQELMQRGEKNGYIRLQCEKALRGMKASVETY